MDVTTWYNKTRQKFEEQGIKVSDASWLDTKNNKAYVCSVETSGSRTFGHPLFEAGYLNGVASSSHNSLAV